jgi:hypothetical protein
MRNPNDTSTGLLREPSRRICGSIVHDNNLMRLGQILHRHANGCYRSHDPSLLVMCRYDEGNHSRCGVQRP